MKQRMQRQRKHKVDWHHKWLQATKVDQVVINQDLSEEVANGTLGEFVGADVFEDFRHTTQQWEITFDGQRVIAKRKHPHLMDSGNVVLRSSFDTGMKDKKGNEIIKSHRKLVYVETNKLKLWWLTRRARH